MYTAPLLDEQNLAPFVSYQSLLPKPQSLLQTPVKALNSFLKPLHFKGQLTEWGTPGGSMARLLPAMVAKALKLECLWISDFDYGPLYPNSWTGLGFNLNNLYFLHENQPLASVRTLISENTFPLLIIDSKQKLSSSDLHFFAQNCREQGTSVFLFRHFYLSHKNGNPFSTQRINSSYSIGRKSFQLNIMKGSTPRKHLSLKFPEVLCG